MKKQILINIAVMVAMGGVTQTVLANTEMNGTLFSSNLMSQDLGKLPQGSLLVFRSDYKNNPMEDMSFTPACHFEPGNPYNPKHPNEDITPAGTIFVMDKPFDFVEKSDGDKSEIKVVINGKSQDGRELVIHCDRTNLPQELVDKSIEEKGLSIHAVQLGLKSSADVDLVVEQSVK